MKLLLEEFKNKLKETPLTANFVEQIEILQNRYGDEYETVAEDLLLMMNSLGFDVKKVSRKYIYDYLKQLDYFLRNGTYGHEEFSAIRSRIYDNEETMMNTYMPGLLLSYSYTTILYEKNHVFLNDFLPQIIQGGQGIEIGFGEGFYLWEILKNRQDLSVYGYDISEHAIRFAKNVLQINNIERERYHLSYGNILEGIDEPDSSMDYGILAEVIEHIPNPESGIRELARILKPGAYLYLTTVIDSNHMDHISNFESPETVVSMLENVGFIMTKKKIYKMTEDFPKSKDISIGLSFIAKRKCENF